MFNKMHTGFRALVWDIAALGCYGGFRQQEYTVDHKNKVKYFIAFTMETILFRDIDRMIICDAFFRPDLVKAVGTRYAVQKNRHNGQVIWYSRGMANSRFCLVVRALSLVRRTAILGQSPSNPICVYLDTTDDTGYLTDIDASALASISSHSLQVTACVLLAEAGMPVYFIKLRLLWTRKCFEDYIRNTLTA